MRVNTDKREPYPYGPGLLNVEIEAFKNLPSHKYPVIRWLSPVEHLKDVVGIHSVQNCDRVFIVSIQDVVTFFQDKWEPTHRFIRRWKESIVRESTSKEKIQTDSRIDFGLLRAQKNLTTKQLADKLGVSLLVLNAFELGAVYDTKMFKKLCVFYQLENIIHIIKHEYEHESC